ncbi:MAG: hypothetical protein ACRDTG_32285 [Pseudonocardiaceae bacterium]
MLRSTGPDRSRLPARHRLGAPGLVHCRVYPEINHALDKGVGSWLSVLLLPLRRQWAAANRQVAGLRRALSLG